MSARASSPVLILGMHRSGTSALAGLLSLAGVDFGERLIPADASVNAKGFWEHEEIVAVHDRVFATLGLSWQDPRPLPDGWTQHPALGTYRDELASIVRRDFRGDGVWGLKDPRLCRLLPLWDPIFADLGVAPRVAMILRHPLEVAASLQRRDRIDVGRALLLWLRHVGEAARNAAPFPTAILTYQALLDDWKAALERVSERLGLPTAPNAAALEAKAAEFVEPGLRHHVASDEAATRHPLLPLAQSLYDANAGREQLEAVWSGIRANVDVLAPAVAQWSAEVETLSAEINGLRSRESYLSSEIERVKSTWSWRLTGPLRALRNLLFGRKREGS